MDAGQIAAFLHAAQCSKVRAGPEWVKSTCPVAHLRHAGGRDEHPSFAVRIEPDGESRCRCLACGYSGPLYPLAWKLGRPDLFDLAQVNNVGEWGDEVPVGLRGKVEQMVGNYWAETRQPRDLADLLPTVPKNEPLDESVLEEFQPIPKWVGQYLHDRGMHEGTIKAWELGYHPKKGRLSIPIRDVDGNLVALSGRALKDQQPKYLHSKFKRDLVLYGKYMSEDSDTAYLCEGFFQAIAIWQLGKRGSLARMGTHLSKNQEKIIIDGFKELVIVPDGDKAGYESAALLAQRLCDRIPVRVAPMPEGFDADTLPAHTLLQALDSALPHATEQTLLVAR